MWRDTNACVQGLMIRCTRDCRSAKVVSMAASSAAAACACNQDAKFMFPRPLDLEKADPSTGPGSTTSGIQPSVPGKAARECTG